MKYQTVIAHSYPHELCRQELNSEVNKLIKDGWELQGGVSVTCERIGYTTWYTLCQAMVKHEEIKEDSERCGVRILR